MEYLDGVTLKHRIGSRPMDTDLILSLAIEIADALGAAHSAGIVNPGKVGMGLPSRSRIGPRTWFISPRF